MIVTYREEAANDGNCKANNGQVECLCGWNTSLLQKVGRVSTERVAVERLDRVDAENNQGAAKIDALEAGNVGRLTLDSALVLSGYNHQINVLVEVVIDVTWGNQSFKDLSCLVLSTSTNKPPGRLWGKENKRNQKYRPEPSVYGKSITAD